MIYIPRRGMSEIRIDYDPSISAYRDNLGYRVSPGYWSEMKVRMRPDGQWVPQLIRHRTAFAKIRSGQWVLESNALWVEPGL